MGGNVQGDFTNEDYLENIKKLRDTNKAILFEVPPSEPSQNIVEIRRQTVSS